MMFSVPDTPFGAALGQFLMLFAQEPLDLEQLHAAFAALEVLAARDQPGRPWPLPLTYEGKTSGLTVETLLAIGRERFARMLPIRAAAVGEVLAQWAGAKVQHVVMSTEPGHGFQLHFTQASHPLEHGCLVVSCAWQLTPSPRLANGRRATSLVAWKGKRLSSLRVEAGGGLVLTLSSGAVLAVRPGPVVRAEDYLLVLAGQAYYQVAGSFVMPAQVDPEIEALE